MALHVGAWVLFAGVLLFSVEQFQCIPCDLAAAKACISQQVIPTTASQCEGALHTLLNTTNCVVRQSEECTLTEKMNVTVELVLIQGNVSSVCGGASCPSLGEQWPKFQQCLVTYSLPKLLTTIENTWNNHHSNTDLFRSTDCQSMGSLHRCLRKNSANCERLRTDLGNLYKANTNFKQIQDICRIEGDPSSSEGPIIKDCDQDVNTVLSQIQTQCPFQFSYQDQSKNIVDACAAMQIQLSCVEPYQQTCPLAFSRFLKPRMEAYAMANIRFCSNVTLNGVRIKPILVTDINCNYDDLFYCFNVPMISFTNLVTPQYSGAALMQFYQWNVFENKDYCGAFMQYNATNTQYCALRETEGCELAFSTYGFYAIPDRTKPDLALYNILEGGPIPMNQFGARFLAERRDFFCHDDCANRTTLNSELSTVCGPALLTNAAAVNTAKTNNQDTGPSCGALTTSIECVANTSIRCPLLLSDVRGRLANAAVVAAMTACNISSPRLLPLGYLPSTSGPIITTTTALPPTTTAPPRTTRFTTSTAAPPPVSTKQASTVLPPARTTPTPSPETTTTKRAVNQAVSGADVPAAPRLGRLLGVILASMLFVRL